jgi:2-amino-4-hydroxy-6-hydroxymethyldihydropteridine diphosphokinase
VTDPAYVGLGGNLGDVFAAFHASAAALGRLGPVRLSSIWRSAPMGPIAAQPPFFNACAELLIRDPLTPAELVGVLLAIERAAGRDRSREESQGPRVLDLDLLVWGARVVHEPTVTLPHPRLHTRAFALAPLIELAGPDLVIPGAGRAGDLLASLPDQMIEKIV